MKTKALVTIVMTCSLLVASPSQAQAIFGVPDCGKWITQADFAKKSWLLGFISGLNVAYKTFNPNSIDPLDKLSSGEQALVWMDKYCRENPLQRVDTGGTVLFLELRNK